MTRGSAPGRVCGLVLVAAWACLAPSAAAAQEEPAASLPAFSALGTPTSPAFILLGVAASSVERPSTPADFAAKLGNATQQFTVVPDQFAVEAAPYWLFRRPELSWVDDADREPLESLERTFNLSVATAPIGTEEAFERGVAVGVSASPFSGSLTEETKTKIRALESALVSTSELFDARRRQRLEVLQAAMAAELVRAGSDQERERIREHYELRFAALNEAVRDEIAEEISELLAPFEGFEPAREGLFMTLSGGSAWTFADAVAEAATHAQWGIWGTMSYRKGAWSPVGVIRYLNRPEATPLTNQLPEEELLDVGFRLIHTTGAFGLSGEYVLRRSFDGADGRHRLVGAVEYRTGEDLWLTAAFGRDHDADAPGSLIAQLGIAFNFSRERYSLD